jgi:hypothetical protein
MNEPESGPSKPPVSRPLTQTGFEEPFYRERPKHGKIYRFFGLETVHSIVTWKPKKLPGPKMSAFLLVAISTGGGYLYDRLEAKKARERYIEQVRWLAERPIKWTDEQQDRIDVYASTIPEDAENDRPIIFFKKYVKVRMVL